MDFGYSTSCRNSNVEPLIAAGIVIAGLLIQLFWRNELIGKKYEKIIYGILAILLVIVVGFIFLSVYKGSESSGNQNQRQKS